MKWACPLPKLTSNYVQIKIFTFVWWLFCWGLFKDLTLTFLRAVFSGPFTELGHVMLCSCPVLHHEDSNTVSDLLPDLLFWVISSSHLHQSVSLFYLDTYRAKVTFRMNFHHQSLQKILSNFRWPLNQKWYLLMVSLLAEFSYRLILFLRI